MTGYLYITFFCLAFAASKVLLANMHYDNSLVILISFSLNILIYGSITLRHFSDFKKKVASNIKNIVTINLATAAYWLFAYMLALQYIEAPLVLCIDLASASIFTFLFLTPIKAYKRNIPTMIAIVCVVICMSMIAEYYRVKINNSKNFFIGASMAVLAGLSNSCLGIFSKRLFKKKFSVPEVITVRFLLASLISSAAVVWKQSWHGLDMTDYRNILLSALLISVMMVFFFQSALQKLGPLLVTTLMPFTPIIAYFMQIYLKGESCSYYVCGTIFICSIILGTMNIMMKKQKNSCKGYTPRCQTSSQ